MGGSEGLGRGAGGGGVLAVALVLLAGCGPDVPGEVPARGDGEVWVVSLDHPEGDWAVCLTDEAVADSVMTADVPTSAASATFGASAGEEDVRRVLDCLDRALTGGDAGVTARRP